MPHIRHTPPVRRAVGILIALAVLVLVYHVLHALPAAVAFGLAAFLLVTLRQPGCTSRVDVPRALLHNLARVTMFAIILTGGSLIFRSVPAGVGFATCALYFLDSYWPAPAPSILADVASKATGLAIVALWIWLTHGDFYLVGLVAVIAAGTVVLPSWAARAAQLPQEASGRDWPRLLGPRPLP